MQRIDKKTALVTFIILLGLGVILKSLGIEFIGLNGLDPERIDMSVPPVVLIELDPVTKEAGPEKVEVLQTFKVANLCGAPFVALLEEITDQGIADFYSQDGRWGGMPVWSGIRSTDSCSAWIKTTVFREEGYVEIEIKEEREPLPEGQEA